MSSIMFTWIPPHHTPTQHNHTRAREGRRKEAADSGRPLSSRTAQPTTPSGPPPRLSHASRAEATAVPMFEHVQPLYEHAFHPDILLLAENADASIGRAIPACRAQLTASLPELGEMIKLAAKAPRDTYTGPRSITSGITPKTICMRSKQEPIRGWRFHHLKDATTSATEHAALSETERAAYTKHAPQCIYRRSDRR